MSNLTSLRRYAGALALVAAGILLPATAAAYPIETSVTVNPPQAVTLPAPFVCGTEWQGTTYPGHGAHNWNLDLNRTDDAGRSDVGQPILAQADGVVVWFKQTGYNRGAGTYVEIDYGDVTVRYIHLVDGSIPAGLAEIGSTVGAGELIGLLGATGHVTGPHLHLEYWDSAGFHDTAWYQLPRGNQIAVAFDGWAMIATPNHPTNSMVSTNCPESVDRAEPRDLSERLEDR